MGSERKLKESKFKIVKKPEMIEASCLLAVAAEKLHFPLRKGTIKREKESESKESRQT